jgi:hypothetical protein
MDDCDGLADVGNGSRLYDAVEALLEMLRTADHRQ